MTTVSGVVTPQVGPHMQPTASTASSPTGATPPPGATATPPTGASPPSASSAGANAKGPSVRYGISDPISLTEPTEQDHLFSAQMSAQLEKEFPQETPEGMAHRESVLEELNAVVREWIVEMGVKEGKSEEESRRGALKIVTLGSYRLGVVQPSSDIDALCIGPPHVSREAFFTAFVDTLKQRDSVVDCVPIPDAFTPVVKLKMRGVSIDLLFARLARPLDASTQEAEACLKKDEVLRGMDDKCVRSLNGYRVADQILQLVPNQEAFRQALRFVKSWARRRGIYSNVLGFFGGITWSLLVARVCQLYPYYAPSQLVNRFFRVYDQWIWSKPVILCDIVESVPGVKTAEVWNPKLNPRERTHAMPVITPAFPAMNSTYNVTETTKRILLDEFRRGYEVVKTEAQRGGWNEVHDPFPYFEHFGHFLLLEVLGKTGESYWKFSGWVESKLRTLLQELERIPGMIIHPNPEQYDLRGSDVGWPLGCGRFIGLAFYKDSGAFAGQSVDLRPALSGFVEVINQWQEKGEYSGKFLLRLKKIEASHLPGYVTDVEQEKKRVRSRQPPDDNPKKRKVPNGA